MNIKQTFHLALKQEHIAATTFDFKNYETGAAVFVRVLKDKPDHDDWCQLKEGEAYGLMLFPLKPETIETPEL